MDAEGIRLNKYLSARAGVSRREADRLIEEGRVQILRASGRVPPGGTEGTAASAKVPASAGDRVFPGDRVFLNGGELAAEAEEKVYFLYHKPLGVVCTSDRRVPGNLADALGYGGYLTYAGRLDKDSSGLLLLTNDGSLIERLMRGANEHEKEYLCEVSRPVTKEFLNAMRRGVEIELPQRDGDGTVVRKTRPCRVIRTGERAFTIILTQGWNRQIRRMCGALGYRIVSICRTRIENLLLGDLGEGEMRPLTDAELETLKSRLANAANRAKGNE